MPEPWSDAEVWAIFSKANSYWPTLDVSPDNFSGFLRERFNSIGDIPPERLADLFLACACLNKVSGAMELMRERTFPTVLRAFRPFDESNGFAAEV
ncbi:MAG TPA: hypothetical protein VHE33_18745 [Acidobacteriaceae bacterium]|nr:hypothetical protein [Acidobacteriaceae bacterium]